MRIRWSLTVVAAVLLFSTGCLRSRRAVQSHPSKVSVTEDKPPALVAGDVVLVEVFGEKDLSGKFQISEEGTVDYPLVGRLKVAGMAPQQLASLLKEKLAQGFLRNPHVAVFAPNFSAKRKIHIWGEVRKAGTFNFTNDMSLIEALTQAGGFTPLADKNGITVTRIHNGRRQEIDMPMGDGQSSKYPLEPGDVIFVPERVF